MTALVWDQSGSRTFESGLDRGVLYLEDGSAVPWNGLLSVVEKQGKTNTPIYYDGKKVRDLVSIGDFQATIKAITYPDEFQDYEGDLEVSDGVVVTLQRPKQFSLSYRTRVGNDIDGQEAGYKIHVLYNLTAIPTDTTYSTAALNPEIVDFSWEVYAVPVQMPGYYPTAQLVFDTRNIPAPLLDILETTLYGDVATNAELPTMTELMQIVEDYYNVEVTITGGGDSWSATTTYGLVVDTADKYTFDNLNVRYISRDSFQIRDNYVGALPVGLLTDFAFAVRPGVSTNEITTGAAIAAQALMPSGLASSGTNSYMAWAKTTALLALTNIYTVVVVLDPADAGTGWRGLLSIPAYTGATHVAPYHALAMVVGTGGSTLVHMHNNAGTLLQDTSSSGAINTATDGTTCLAIRRNGSTVDFVKNGVLLSTATGVTGNLVFAGSGNVTLANRANTSPGEGCAGTYLFGGIANRALTDAELLTITANPTTFL